MFECFSIYEMILIGTRCHFAGPLRDFMVLSTCMSNGVKGLKEQGGLPYQKQKLVLEPD